jgi:hypothetical protein
VGLAEAEGFAHAVVRGALQPQGLGGRRMIALRLGQRLAQQHALAGHRGGRMTLRESACDEVPYGA